MLTALRILPFLFLALAMFYSPQEVLQSAATGLSLWANYIVPALLPFFIISDLLMKQGFVHFLGVLLEPVMRPLFRLPGKASFVIAMTHTAGIPIGAILTCNMRKEGELTQIEGERLLAFTSNPSPGYMFGAVASGMMGNPGIGIVLAGSVYLGNLLVGLLFRFYGRSSIKKAKHGFSVYKAWHELESAQKRNKKPLGEMMGESIKQSISTMLHVGGFIVFFSVITHMMTLWHITSSLSVGLEILTNGFITTVGGNAIIQGIMETTLGCKATVTSFSSFNVQIGILAFLLGWGGISVFAQVASFTASTDLRFFPFVLGRTLHAFFALVISQILLIFTDIPTTTLPGYFTEGSNTWLLSLRWSTFFFIGSVLLLIILGLLFRRQQKIRRL